MRPRTRITHLTPSPPSPQVEAEAAVMPRTRITHPSPPSSQVETEAAVRPRTRITHPPPTSPQVEAEAAERPRTRITRLVEEVETFRKTGKELSIRNEEKAKLQVGGWFGFRIKEVGRFGCVGKIGGLVCGGKKVVEGDENGPCPASNQEGWPTGL